MLNKAFQGIQLTGIDEDEGKRGRNCALVESEASMFKFGKESVYYLEL